MQAVLERVRRCAGCQGDGPAASAALPAECADDELDEFLDGAEVGVDDGVVRLLKEAVGRGDGVDVPDGSEGLPDASPVCYVALVEFDAAW